MTDKAAETIAKVVKDVGTSDKIAVASTKAADSNAVEKTAETVAKVATDVGTSDKIAVASTKAADSGVTEKAVEAVAKVVKETSVSDKIAVATTKAADSGVDSVVAIGDKGPASSIEVAKAVASNAVEKLNINDKAAETIAKVATESNVSDSVAVASTKAAGSGIGSMFDAAKDAIKDMVADAPTVAPVMKVKATAVVECIQSMDSTNADCVIKNVETIVANAAFFL